MPSMETTIRRVFPNNASKQLLITIPKNIGIKPGDFVKLTKVKL
jgi:hypothetical protein